jgi:eukaryotic-like serine/threonine-protein kinase
MSLEEAPAIGGYRVERLLGRGGFGDVYAAQPVAGDDALAIKVLHAELCHTPEAVARFRREAELMARLDHPSIVAIRELGTLADGRPFLVMDRLDGVDLEVMLAERGHLPLDEALAILEALAGALDAAHAAGVIHRDVKPSNVFLDRRTPNRVVLLDFGVAKLLDPAAGSLTGSLVAIGTPTCMAPEQIVGGEITARTDVYGLANLAFHLIAGEPAFRDPSPTVLQQLHLHARRPRPSSRAALPVAIDAPIVRGMDRDPRRRQPSPGAFVAELGAAIRAVSAVPPSGEVIAAAVHVKARAPAERAGTLDDELLDSLEGVLDALVAGLVEDGLTVVSDSGDLVLLAVARGDVRALAAASADRLAAIGPGVVATVALHVGEDVDTLAWLPDDLGAGVWASARALGRPGDGWERIEPAQSSPLASEGQ